MSTIKFGSHCTSLSTEPEYLIQEPVNYFKKLENCIAFKIKITEKKKKKKKKQQHSNSVLPDQVCGVEKQTMTMREDREGILICI